MQFRMESSLNYQYLKNYARFFSNMNYQAFQTRTPSYRQKTLYAFYISNRDFSGKLNPSNTELWLRNTYDYTKYI